MTKKFLAFLTMGLAIAACSPKGEVVDSEENVDDPLHVETAAEVAPTQAEKDSVAYLLGTYFGNVVKYNNFGDDLSQRLIKKGFNDLLKAKGNPQDSTYAKQFKYDPAVIDRLFNEYLGKKRKESALLNKEAEVKYFEKLDKKDEIVKTESGLRYEIIEEGSDVKPSLKDTVSVYYKLCKTDGEVIQEIPEDAEPYAAPLEYNVAGFKEGLQLIGEGGKIKLYVPAELAYGSNGNRGIEPNTTLLFEVSLVKVGKFVEPEQEKK